MVFINYLLTCIFKKFLQKHLRNVEKSFTIIIKNIIEFLTFIYKSILMKF
jgi:hypothetical protein